MLSRDPLWVGASDAAGHEDAHPVKARGRTRGQAVSRVHVSLPEELHVRLLEIQRDTYAGSLTEVMKNALLVYAALLEEHKAGRTVYTEGKGGADRQRLAVFL